MMSDTLVKTFVFLDLESTSLPSPGVQPCITELSLVAVHRRNFDFKSLKLPRVMNKLLICVNPRKPIEEIAAKLTG